MNIVVLFFIFAVGIVLTMWAGEMFVTSSSNIATKWGIPKFIVGATIVSFATTLPELIVSTISASEGRVDMAIGNGIGSVIANLGLILAIAVLFKPIVIEKKEFGKKGLLLIFGLILLWFLTNSGLLEPFGSVLLFITLGVFVVDNVVSAKKLNSLTMNERDSSFSHSTLTKNIVFFVIGAIGIIFGSKVLVSVGGEIALKFGIQENVIAKTMIAVGTSLPELATAIVAIRKSENALVVGNVLGANIIDTLLILPVCAIISGGTLPVSLSSTLIDIPVAMILSAVFVVPTLLTKKLQRWQGVVGLMIYVNYFVSVFIL